MWLTTITVTVKRLLQAGCGCTAIRTRPSKPAIPVHVRVLANHRHNQLEASTGSFTFNME